MAFYVIRIDDVHERMNLERLVNFTTLLHKYGVRPILGVIPKNLDESLIWGPVRSDFDEHLRELTRNGAILAIHGWNHLYTSKCSGLLKLWNRAEFAGHGIEQQAELLRLGLANLRDRGHTPHIFMAPGHGLDRNTLKALSRQGLALVTDGFYMFPQNLEGVWMIPQQLWKFRAVHLPGIYTICLHLDTLSNNGYEQLKHAAVEFLEKNQAKLIDVLSLDLKRYDHWRFRVVNWVFQLVFQTVLSLRRLSRTTSGSVGSSTRW